MRKPRLYASFSGGRTSAFMTKWILDNLADQYEIIVLFANTGEEHEKTLDFVHNCDVHFGFNTVWLEADVRHGEKKSTAHRVVSFDSASRQGEPFEEMIRKYGIPNKSWPQCTRELKLNPIKSYLRSIGWSDCTAAVGIRTDETRRVNAKAVEERIIYPLIDLCPMDKQDVLAWWEDQPFDLEIQEHQGNCKWCWKKSLAKHIRLVKESPEVFDFPRRMERLYGMAGTNPNGQPRVFFREERSTDDLFALAAEADALAARQLSLNLDSGSCAESCELYPMEQAA